jgi:hypothetical protein
LITILVTCILSAFVALNVETWDRVRTSGCTADGTPIACSVYSRETSLLLLSTGGTPSETYIVDLRRRRVIYYVEGFHPLGSLGWSWGKAHGVLRAKLDHVDGSMEIGDGWFQFQGIGGRHIHFTFDRG